MIAVDLNRIETVWPLALIKIKVNQNTVNIKSNATRHKDIFYLSVLVNVPVNIHGVKTIWILYGCGNLSSRLYGSLSDTLKQDVMNHPKVEPFAWSDLV